MIVKPRKAALALQSRFVGGLPLVNSILNRLGFDGLLAQALASPSKTSRGKVDSAAALGVLVRNIVLNERQPIYTHTEWTSRVEPALIGLAEGQAAFLNDDRIGRSLDRLFDADRSAMLTKLVLSAIREFNIDLDQFHNDSTTLTLTGEYRDADGREVRNQPTVVVTYGHNKDHRPDLKQLLFVLTVSADGAVPIHYRALDGNTEDSTTHIESWETLRQLAGRADFLYVADCKLCSKEILAHIDKHGGRFITVLPRNRRADKWFRTYIQTNDPPWEVAVRRPNPNRRNGPEDVWKVVEAAVPSDAGYKIVWVSNSLMAAEDANARGARIENAYINIERLQTKLQGKRCRLRVRRRVEDAVQKILKGAGAQRWVRVEITEHKEPVYRQEKRGRPGVKTRYSRRERIRFSVAARIKDDVVTTDERSDGMFPLITNCKDLPLKEVLAAYKFQPRLEKRHEQLKSVQRLAPMWLQNVSRIEAVLFLISALLVQALGAGDPHGHGPRKDRSTADLSRGTGVPRPSTERILNYLPAQRHRLRKNGRLLQIRARPQRTA